ncbi:Veg protein [Alkalibacterium sp. AK22]|uniref:Veg family protein n=1 Tax=Alkalibacterium sp. AK22 TaxID=1229520 RepID=UPI00044567E2|nr:Veg family protein [Alkalibacterium sp. AK22]EXJ23462.1 Veg protein [Alkalibacterium sp. AK22]
MPTTLASIKKTLDSQIGNEIRLIAQVGRKKTTERKGILTETYPAVFIVELDQEENAVERVSYSYTDVLTNSVAIMFDEEKEAVMN